jgi:hypothetical protein
MAVVLGDDASDGFSKTTRTTLPVLATTAQSAMLQALAELSFDLEDTRSELITHGAFAVATTAVVDVEHGEVATMASWCCFNLLEVAEHQNQAGYSCPWFF